MRVLHVIPAIADCYGGPSQLVLEMCQTLRQAGVEVEIATTDADGTGELPVEAGRLQDWRGLPVWFFHREFSEALKYSRPFARWLRAHVADYDLVHIHAVFSHSCLAAARACVAAGIPYIVRPLGTLDPWSMAQKPWRKKLFLQLGGRSMLEHAVAIQYTTEMERSATQSSLGLSGGRVIANGVDLEAYDQPLDREALQRRFPRLQPGAYVLYLGRIATKKNVDGLIRSFETLAGQSAPGAVRLVIAGSGNDEYRQRIEKQVEASPLRESILLTGWVSGTDKINLLKGAKLLVLPSRNENYGIVVAEAMACGVPVVLTPGVYLGEAVNDGGAGWICPSGDELAEILAAALADSGELDARGRKGRELVRRSFSWRVVGGDLVDMYGSVLAAGEG